MTITPKFKELFFDRPAITKAIGRGERPALSKAGAEVRRDARRLLKYRKGPASAGQPPHVHRSDHYSKTIRSRKTGLTRQQPASPLRELLFFVYEPATHGVVIGPVGFGKAAAGQGAPEVEEFGGTVTRRVRRSVKRVGGKARSPAQAAAFRRKILDGSITLPTQLAQQPVTFTATYPARPYMAPSFQEALDKGAIPEAWRGVVTA